MYKTRGFPNRGERYGAKYENGVAYLLSYTVSIEKLWTQNTRIIHDVWRLLILSNEEKTNDYENFEKGMIYMNILKKGGGGSREKGEEETKSMPHAPVIDIFKVRKLYPFIFYSVIGWIGWITNNWIIYEWV